MKSKKFPLVGWSLVLIGIIHNLFGVIAGWRLLVDATKAGLMGVWDTPPSRGLIFWFLVTGFALIAIGLLAAHLERSGVAIPWSFIVFFGLLTLTGVVLMPASGFLLLLFPIAASILRHTRH